MYNKKAILKNKKIQILILILLQFTHPTGDLIVNSILHFVT